VPKILLTGFEPWADWSHNPSGDVAQVLDGENIGGCPVVSAILPVVHGEDIAIVKPLIETHQPVAVVSLGLHGSAAVIHVERVAVNLKVIDGVDYPVVDGAPDAYFATIPTRATMDRIKLDAQIPAKLTYSAGTFLCNHIMYNVLHYISERSLGVKAGFLHIPPTPDMVCQSNRASMALDDIAKGVRVALEVVAENLNVSGV